MYRSWSDHLTSDIQLCPVELPGRGQRFGEVPFRQLQSLIAVLGSILLPHLDQPFAFFGHSMGALLGLELTRWLRRQQAPLPNHLFVSGRSAPQLPPQMPLLHCCPDHDFMVGLKSYNGTPETILQHAELMEILLPTLRADFELFETYQYVHEAPLPCPISAFGGLEDRSTPRHTVQAWQSQTSTHFTDYWFPGDHFFLQANESSLVTYCSQALLRPN